MPSEAVHPLDVATDLGAVIGEINIAFPSPCFVLEGPSTGGKFINFAGEIDSCTQEIYLYIFSNRELAQAFLDNMPMRKGFLHVAEPSSWQELRARFYGTVDGFILDFQDNEDIATVIPLQ